MVGSAVLLSSAGFGGPTATGTLVERRATLTAPPGDGATHAQGKSRGRGVTPTRVREN
jgi:hypothetical protein